jgi:transcriptional regulator with XRE-family HTH domain
VDIKRVVGRNIRVARKAQALRQLVPAERSELSTDSIGKVERGTKSPSIESLKAIATAKNVSLGELFAGQLQGDARQEALIELIGLCRGGTREDIRLLVKIAPLLFQRQQDWSRRPERRIGASHATERVEPSPGERASAASTPRKTGIHRPCIDDRATPPTHARKSGR